MLTAEDVLSEKFSYSDFELTDLSEKEKFRFIEMCSGIPLQEDQEKAYSDVIDYLSELELSRSERM